MPGRRRWRVAAGAACVALLLPLAAACVSGVEKERADVPEVPAVTAGGLRYEAPPWMRSRGLAQNGGYVAALDAVTGEERWIVKVYSAAPDDGKEADKRDVFITDLSLAPDARALLVTDERGRRYRLDLATRQVSPLAPARP